MKKLKLAVIIPCLNEEKSLPGVLSSIPKKIDGILRIEVIVVDDGSIDKTGKIAQKMGVKHLISHKRKQGLTRAFEDGLKKAIELRADMMVNIDGDGQYEAKEIPKLIKPLLQEKADIVLGNRQVRKLAHMPILKKIGNMGGSFIMRFLINTRIQDASTGFRAFTRGVAQSFNLISQHTYTHETIIHAYYSGFKIIEIPVKFKKRKQGQSRLIVNVWGHIKTSAAIIVRTILIYKAFKYLIISGLGMMTLGLLGFLRFLWFYLVGEGSGHIQSLIFSSILLSIGFSTILMGILADLVGINRKLIGKIKSIYHQDI